MEKYRRVRIITIIVLMVVMAGLTIGFAAFTSVLTISSTATVTPDESSFSVLFSSSGTSQATAQITPTVSGATGDKATISGTTISGLKANFTAPGQTVTYTFWAHNAGSYIAYLRNITYQNAVGESTFKACTPGTGTTESLVTAACEDISVTVSVGSTSASDTVGVTSHPLGINAYEQVIVTITYASDGDLADGPFDIKFGDITLNYGSVDGTGEVYTVTYDSSITNNGYPSTVASGDTLSVTFTEPIPKSIKLYVDGAEVDSLLYTYSNGVLTYSNALGNITISGQNLINFTLDGISFQAEIGMTWIEWVNNSNYNTDEFRYAERSSVRFVDYCYFTRYGREGSCEQANGYIVTATSTRTDGYMIGEYQTESIEVAIDPYSQIEEKTYILGNYQG